MESGVHGVGFRVYALMIQTWGLRLRVRGLHSTS